MNTFGMGSAVGRMCGAALITPTPIFVATIGPMRILASTWTSRQIRATDRAITLTMPVRPECDKRLRAVPAWTRFRRLPSVPSAVFAVGITATARWDEIFRGIVSGIAVEVIGTHRSPRQFDITPMATWHLAAEFGVQDHSANQHLAVFSCERVVRQISLRSVFTHVINDSRPWRTNDPGQLAKAMRVAAPPKQTDGQVSLFDELDVPA